MTPLIMTDDDDLIECDALVRRKVLFHFVFFRHTAAGHSLASRVPCDTF